MTWSPYEFDDDSMTLRTEDPGDIARILRLFNIELPRRVARPTAIFVTIQQSPLTGQNLNTNSTVPEHESSDDQCELPF